MVIFTWTMSVKRKAAGADVSLLHETDVKQFISQISQHVQFYFYI